LRQAVRFAQSDGGQAVRIEILAEFAGARVWARLQKRQTFIHGLIVRVVLARLVRLSRGQEWINPRAVPATSLLAPLSMKSPVELPFAGGMLLAGEPFQASSDGGFGSGQWEV